MTNRGSLAAVATMALILVLASPTVGFAEYKINERANAVPRPPMRPYQPGVIVGPIASPYHNATQAPDRHGDHDHDHDRDRAALAAGVAAGVVLGGAVGAAPGIYYVPTPSPVDDPVGYCMQTYSSYDPQSGTYIGDDGKQYPCP